MARNPPLSTELFDYDLPEELIAQEPAEQRTGSRLLHLDRKSGGLHHLRFGSFPDFLNSDDLLVLNDTRVFPARFAARRASGGSLEILLVEYPSPEGEAGCIARPGRKIRGAEEVFLCDGSSLIIRREKDRFYVRGGSDSLERILLQHGQVPLPPYIRREGGAPGEQDRERYQTVYARQDGAVAAPTAGLHFDKDMLQTVQSRGIRIATVTLHVGPGTFQPVRVADVTRHRMEAEVFQCPPETAEAVMETKASRGRVVAVGTTVVRTLESAWDGEVLRPGKGATELFIHPGYRFGVVDAILTNFHLPRSTLLMLVCAFGGIEPVVSAYREAVKEKYRFYSYGDAMFIE